MILNNGCLKSEQKKWNCLHCTSLTLQDNDNLLSGYPTDIWRMTGGYPPSEPRVPEAEVWTEEMKLFALHISYSTKLDLFIPFLTFLARIRIRKFMRIRIRAGQKHADPYGSGSGSETLPTTIEFSREKYYGCRLILINDNHHLQCGYWLKTLSNGEKIHLLMLKTSKFSRVGYAPPALPTVVVGKQVKKCWGKNREWKKKRKWFGFPHS